MNTLVIPKIDRDQFQELTISQSDRFPGISHCQGVIIYSNGYWS